MKSGENGLKHRARARRRFFQGLVTVGAAGLLSSCGAPADADQQVGGAAAGGTVVEFFPNEDPNLPFSTAVRVGDVIYLSGQIGVDPAGEADLDIQAQTKNTLDRIAASLADIGASMDDVFKCTLMLDDISEWQSANEVYVDYFKPGRLPARSAFGADGLALGAKVEIECLAVAPDTAQ